MNPNLTPMNPISATLLVVAIAITGCGKPEPAVPTDSPSSTAPAQSAMPSLQTGGGPAAPAGPAVAAAPAPPPAIDLAAMERPANEAGDPMSDLEVLNVILFNYNEALATGAAASKGPARTYKTEAEEMAATEARQRAIDAGGQVRDLSQLVKAGVIKALPKPPAGKKFAIDPKTQKVVLVSAP